LLFRDEINAFAQFAQSNGQSIRNQKPYGVSGPSQFELWLKMAMPESLAQTFLNRRSGIVAPSRLKLLKSAMLQQLEP
jgi:hypothetical protein